MRQVHPGHPSGTVSRPQRMRPRQLQAQRPVQRRGQHHHPVFGPLALAHDDRAVLKIEVLDAQAQALQQTQAGAIKQLTQQPGAVVQRRKKTAHFSLRQHGGQARLALGSADLGQPRHLLFQHVLIEKQQRRQRLLVG